MTTDREALNSLRVLRRSYERICAGLPWLDACVWDDDPPAWPEYARPSGLAGVRAAAARGDLAGRLAEVKRREGWDLLRFAPAVTGGWADVQPLCAEMSATGTPLVVLHTDVPLEKIGALAEQWPRLRVIVESGPLKILYFFAELQELLGRHANLYLCTYNLCNWLALERLEAAGLGERLVFGSHSPRFSAAAAQGPVALARLPWERKCDLAGNNLRRLLGRPPVRAAEVAPAEGAAFIVDAHAHSGAPGRFPVPDESFGPADWVAFMDACGIETLYLTPLESITDPAADPGALSRELRAGTGGRVRFLEVFDPRAGVENLRRIEHSLDNPDCVGVKIHPSFHETAADDERYEPIYALAERRQRPILTHSWDVSPTNPVQHLSHPDRFRALLGRHPGVRLVLGHAGGRPGALEAVGRLCGEFAGVRVDLAGDYYDNGLVECLAERIGVARVLFGSDVNWMDPRGNLAPVLASRLSDEEALGVLRGNALATYGR